jgi:voltage-dependent potassium channel beta subunit
MEYRRLGKSGLQVSALSFGAWVTLGRQVGEDVAETCMQTAYDAGVNFFDNAEAYADGEAELVMGRIFRKLGWRRSSYLVSSKVFFGATGDRPNESGLSRKHVIEACHDALRRLQVDYLDLYFCHRPDPNTPIEETVRAMDTLVAQGKVLYWGTSEWSAQEITQACGIAREHHLTPPTMEQPQYNLLHRERVEKEYARLYGEFGLGTTTWSPLACGLLTGKYNDGIPADSRARVPGLDFLRDVFEGPDAERRIAKVKRLAPIAAGLGVSLPALSIAWCLKNPNVSTVILGASRVSQLTENLAALEVVPKLTPDVLAAIDEITAPTPSP